MKNKKLKIYLVIPTIRDLDFLKSWKKEFKDCHLIVVEDGGKENVNVPNKNFLSITHFNWKDIDNDLGKNSWIIPRKNAGIRNYGFWKAYQMGADIILTLDDDCYPDGDALIEGHINNLNKKSSDKWFATYPNDKWMNTRGFPYDVRNKFPVMISHGLWSGALDLDAKTEIKLPKLLTENKYPQITQFIPKGYYYPMCSMNLAFRREMTPIIFFPMMGFDPKGESWGFDRYDDIWAGIFSKKIMDHLNFGVVNGSPFIKHNKASKVEHNHTKEVSGMLTNEVLWKAVEKVNLTAKTPKTCYLELANKIKFPNKPYFRKLRKAMVIWANLF